MPGSAQQLIDRTSTEFARCFQERPSAAGAAPGRVEILGNHTDYNGGAVLTAAIDRHVVAVGRLLAERTIRVRSLDLDATVETSLDDARLPEKAEFFNYVRSALAVLSSAGVEVCGLEMVIAGDLPIGAGLGSSAALEAATAMLALQLHNRTIETMELARLLRRGENEFVGVQCGLLDQFSTLAGREGACLLLDCATETHEVLTLGSPPPTFVICDSGTTRRLGADAPYNQRRAECEQALALLNRALDRATPALCAISPAELKEVANQVPEPLLSRARHVIGEHERVLAGRESLRAHDLDQLGRLLVTSHQSSQTLFGNSCDALDSLYETAGRQEGHLGTRLCGAGWGGCTVSLVDPDRVDAFVSGMRASWPTPADPGDRIHICQASGGAHALSLRD